MTETAVKPKADTKPKSEAKPKADKSNEILAAVVDHVTRLGTEADDALRAKVHELSGGKLGGKARGTVEEDENAE